MVKNIIYLGIFFPNEEKLITGKELEKVIPNKHITLAFRPKEIPEGIIGKPVKVKVVGYACDGNNEGFQSEVVTEDKDILNLLKEVRVPHITTSVSNSGKPVDTWKLNFQPIEPFCIDGIVGYFDGANTICCY